MQYTVAMNKNQVELALAAKMGAVTNRGVGKSEVLFGFINEWYPDTRVAVVYPHYPLARRAADLYSRRFPAYEQPLFLSADSALTVLRGQSMPVFLEEPFLYRSDFLAEIHRFNVVGAVGSVPGSI